MAIEAVDLEQDSRGITDVVITSDSTDVLSFEDKPRLFVVSQNLGLITVGVAEVAIDPIATMSDPAPLTGAIITHARENAGDSFRFGDVLDSTSFHFTRRQFMNAVKEDIEPFFDSVAGPGLLWISRYGKEFQLGRGLQSELDELEPDDRQEDKVIPIYPEKPAMGSNIIVAPQNLEEMLGDRTFNPDWEFKDGNLTSYDTEIDLHPDVSKLLGIIKKLGSRIRMEKISYEYNHRKRMPPTDYGRFAGWANGVVEAVNEVLPVVGVDNGGRSGKRDGRTEYFFNTKGTWQAIDEVESGQWLRRDI